MENRPKGLLESLSKEDGALIARIATVAEVNNTKGQEELEKNNHPDVKTLNLPQVDPKAKRPAQK